MSCHISERYSLRKRPNRTEIAVTSEGRFILLETSTELR